MNIVLVDDICLNALIAYLQEDFMEKNKLGGKVFSFWYNLGLIIDSYKSDIKSLYQVPFPISYAFRRNYGTRYLKHFGSTANSKRM
jgi:hypothetical protein